MKLLVLTSRSTCTRDIVNENFGRQLRLFGKLGDFDNEVEYFIADYTKHENRNTILNGNKVYIISLSLLTFYKFIFELGKCINKGKYKFLIGSGDPLWGSVGYFITRFYKIKFIYDLQDNYEIYAMYKVPFLKYLDRYVMKHSEIIIVVSSTLKEKIKKII